MSLGRSFALEIGSAIMPLARPLAMAVALFSTLASSEPAPAFDMKALDGTQYALSRLSGKVVVLNFWFKDCGPCRAELGDLNRVVDTYKPNKDVVFLGFSTDEAAELGPFLKEHPFQYTVIPGSDDVAEAYDVHAFPTHIIIDRQGQIAARWSGGHDALYRLTTGIAAVLQGVKVPEPRPPATSASRSGPAQPLPVISITPGKPRRGDTVKLLYAVTGEDRQSSLEYGVYANWDIHADDAFSSGFTRMRKEGKAFVHELKVPMNANAIHVRFTSRGTSGEDEERMLPILGTDGKPLRNAFSGPTVCNAYLPFERELENYPDNPFALAQQAEARADEAESYEEGVRRELPAFERAARGTVLERSAAKAELLFEASDFDGALKLVRELMAREPHAFLTRQTLASMLMDDQAPKKLPARLGLSAWKTLAAKDDVWSRQAAIVADPAVLDTRSAEKICATWLAAEPDNPEAHFCKARVRERQGRMEEALRASRNALDWMSAGRLRLYRPGSLRGVVDDEVALWEHQAELALRMKRYPEALAAIEASLAAQQRAEEVPAPETYILWARIAEAMGQLALAEEAWRASVRAGSDDLAPLKRIYQKRHGSLQGFKPPLPEEQEQEPKPAVTQASRGGKPQTPREGPPVSQYPPELRALLARLEGEGHERVAQQLREELARAWEYTRHYPTITPVLVLGRVLLEDPTDRVIDVEAQMRILPGGYFVTAVRDLQRPIGLAMHGYEPYALETTGLPREQPLIWAGELALRKVSPERKARLSGRLELPPGVDPAGAKVELRHLNRVINSPSGGSTGRSSREPSIKSPVKPDGSFSADGFSPGTYSMLLSHPELVQQYAPLTFKPGETLDAGTVLLERPLSVDASFLVAEKPPFTGQQIHQQVVKGGESWVLSPNSKDSSQNWPRLTLKQEKGVLWLVSRHGPCWLVDLGKGPLDRHMRVEETALPSNQAYEVKLEDDHVYLLKQEGLQAALLHVRVKK